MKLNKITIYTNKLADVKKFYVDYFGFQIRQDEVDYFSILVGYSELVFIQTEVIANPYYHFAFDIPPEKYNEIKSWLQQRVELLTEEGQDEIYFSGFDAKSVYFYDPADNIVEFMARNEHKNKVATEHFTVNDILGISEIGLVINDLEQSMKLLKQYNYSNIANYIDEDSLNFIFNKQESTYLLLTKAHRRWLFSDKVAQIFPISVETEDEHIDVENGKLFINELN